MNGCGGTGKFGKKYYYYKCGAKIKNTDDCNNSAPRKDELEEFVINKIFEFLSDENISCLVDSCMKLIDKEMKASDTMRLEKLIAENKKKTQNIVTVIARGTASQILLDELEKLEREKTDLETALTEENIKGFNITREELKRYFRGVRDLPRDSVMNQRKVLNLFVNRLTWYSDKTVGFCFNVSGKLDKRLSYTETTPQYNENNDGSQLLSPCSSLQLEAPPYKTYTHTLQKVCVFFLPLHHKCQSIGSARAVVTGKEQAL